MERKKVALEIAQDLFAAEAAIDAAYAATATLAATLADGRVRAKLSAVIGQDAFDKISQVMVRQAEVRGVMIQAHHALAQAQTDIGLRHVAFGFPDKPAAPSTLRAVEAA
ncbi:hypothetical protein [Caulobacter sp. NIBR2454]|uniref:hypothetical protein n=1 Tax=Caulobacter sp. NIBR2454 TaxID=3015996 RepID=UPI0022B66191|nr:hypothetical protein [Caulobacter sp. NIBR2454]